MQCRWKLPLDRYSLFISLSRTPYSRLSKRGTFLAAFLRGRLTPTVIASLDALIQFFAKPFFLIYSGQVRNDFYIPLPSSLSFLFMKTVITWMAPFGSVFASSARPFFTVPTFSLHMFNLHPQTPSRFSIDLLHRPSYHLKLQYFSPLDSTYNVVPSYRATRGISKASLKFRSDSVFLARMARWFEEPCPWFFFTCTASCPRWYRLKGPLASL